MKLTLTKQMVKNPRLTGAVVPSSKQLASVIAKQAKLQTAQSVVELGCGTGAFTKEILNNISENTVFFALELNKELAQQARQACPKATVYNDSAQNLKKYLNKYNLATCDKIIAGLPWTNFSYKEQDQVMKEVISALPKGGFLVCFAYIHSLLLPTGRRFRKKLNKNFSTVARTKIVWGNLPPAFVYCAVK